MASIFISIYIVNLNEVYECNFCIKNLQKTLHKHLKKIMGSELSYAGILVWSEWLILPFGITVQPTIWFIYIQGANESAILYLKNSIV